MPSRINVAFIRVDDPALLSDKVLALAVGPFGILVRHGWNRTICSEPVRGVASRERHVEQFGIEPVCLGAPVLALRLTRSDGVTY